MYNKIIVAVDGGFTAESAAKYGIMLAKQCSAKLLVVFVITKDLNEEDIAGGRESVERVLSRARSEGVDADGLVEHGPVVQTLKSIAEIEDVDLVVSSARHEDRKRRFFVRSVSQKLMASLSCSGVVVRVSHLGKTMHRHRILAFAYRPAPDEYEMEIVESDLIFTGLMGMIDPPHPSDERLLNRALITRAYLFLCPIEALAAMSGFFHVLFKGGWVWGTALAASDVLYRKATTACMTGIVVTQVANGMVCRTARESVSKIGFFTNRLLLAGIVFEIVLQIILVYTPIGQTLLALAPIPLSEWLFLIPFAILLFAAEEGRKRMLRQRANSYTTKASE